ncbi:uncharacterized protein [Argopecten irradians]|uniref:uncharacterized protein n=1 Tax=Argopecten irradians TaxID=31199 RepID=UPI0037198B45
MCRDVSNSALPNMTVTDKPGYLSIVRTGIKSIAHCTVESLTEIRRSEYVFFLVDDTVSELFLQDLRPDGIDLNVFLHKCDDDKFSTCVKVVEICLNYARKGSTVCIVFHGDSYINATISQRLQLIAKSDGINLKAFPSPGLMESLTASLQLDVSIGTICLTAVEFLLSNIDLDTCCNVILRQLEDVKDFCHTGDVSGLQAFHLLVVKLMKTYTDSQEVVLYQGTQYCLLQPPYEHVTLTVLANITEEQLDELPADCSLFIPNVAEPTVDITTGMSLGCLTNGTHAHAIVKKELGQSQNNYGSQECRAIQELKSWVLPGDYMWTTDNELSDLLCEMSLNSKLLHHWEETGNPTLTDHVQNSALQSKDDLVIEDAIRCRMSYDPQKPTNEEGRTEMIPLTIKQMIVLYEDDVDDVGDDDSITSTDSDVVREYYTADVPKVPPSTEGVKQ